MKILKNIVIILSVALLLWINAPEGVEVDKIFLGQKINFTVNPPVLNINWGKIDINRDFTTHLGLDLEGGSRLVFQADTSKVEKENLDEALNSARNIIERRVNYFGVSEPNIQTIKSGDYYRIAVELPGVNDVSSAVDLIGSTAQLSFKEEREATEGAKEATAEPVFARLTKDTGLTGEDVDKATVVFDPQTGDPTVRIDFTREGSKKFSQITKENLSKPVGIFLDNFLISAPIVQQQITDGTAIISGSFTVEDAQSLAVTINSGALPLPIELVEQKNIGPSLGQQEVTKSMYAAVVGVLMVMLFMILVYGKLGVIACISLLIYALISHAIFRLIPVVLTLPGIAGFILSIGMAVDANILIFERIKEERRKGKKIKVAIRLGFKRAVDAIKDANLTTLLVMFVLFNPLNWEFLPQYGLVRGFALTLSIGVMASLFTSLVITKRFIDLYYKEE